MTTGIVSPSLLVMGRQNQPDKPRPYHQIDETSPKSFLIPDFLASLLKAPFGGKIGTLSPKIGNSLHIKDMISMG